MFDKILIANRGEIACRIIRTAKQMGIRTLAVYSDADAESMHVALADEAYRIGAAPARESYLRAGRILEVALASGAQAVHPGYGFMAENAAFAAACAKAGIVFIGPPVAAIEAMGSKSAAKTIMAQADVPLIPGYHGDEQSAELLQTESVRVGYPQLIKACAGGGGKGMRVVQNADEFITALEAVKREAIASFGDENVLLERYLTKPRHVEIQIFADMHGNVLHLFERDCSIQRRHQKILEEAPAPGMTARLRTRMGEAAVAAAKAIGYVGAGTVEFLLDENDAFYFMEMNTRLQVEHPVTEMITGQDLVEWQLRVACKQPLPLDQKDLAIAGHAIEARIYAEDPDRDFLPSIGLLRHLRTPAENANVRIDTGVRQGDEVSMHYDPMIAKLIVWDTNRDAALRRLRQALSELQVVGVTTNIALLSAIAAHSAFAEADLHTGFITEHGDELFVDTAPVSDKVLALACLDVLLRRGEEARRDALASSDPCSPWNLTNGWQLNSDNFHELIFIDGEARLQVIAHYRPDGYLLDLPGGPQLVRGERHAGGDLCADLGGARSKATVVRHGADLTIMSHGFSHRLTLHDPHALCGELDEAGGKLTAPMPGKVIAVMVKVGDEVKKGRPLVILEAMKMEHTIVAPVDGIVSQVNFKVGEQVSDGDALLAFEIAEAVEAVEAVEVC
ncbi:MAG: acetyl/propionyl/methylcrotonyl-CoA carboxylase subunit alpha [Desulfuromonadales bacterium]|nr:acetyl/propionyl/methylcrotonyl-CoA carboxylase subunit alpha [Desulfuromonadales bacterium]